MIFKNSPLNFECSPKEFGIFNPSLNTFHPEIMLHSPLKNYVHPKK